VIFSVTALAIKALSEQGVDLRMVNQAVIIAEQALLMKRISDCRNIVSILDV